MIQSLNIIKRLMLLVALLLTGCISSKEVVDDSTTSLQMYSLNNINEVKCEDNYRTTYEIFPYSFADSNNDGIGDLQGIISKLDYIQDTGFNALWLTPVCKSMTYHKYDVVDYYTIDPEFGSLDDYKQLIKECHNRNIDLYFDLVLNHTSSQHEWFKEAVNYLKSHDTYNSEECKYLDYYNFNQEGGSGFNKIEGTNWYYECPFWSEMPDLNLDNEEVRSEISKIVKYWLDLGIDGFRLDATTYYYSGNSDKNVEFLSWLNNTVKSIKSDAYIVGEAWTNINEYSKYYGSHCDSFFDFAFASKDGYICQSVNGNLSASDFVKAMIKSEEMFSEYNEDYIVAPFYTNHDLARSAGYYAQDDGSKTKLAMGVNLMMNGNAFVYYGEEIGMKGSGKDENKRAPMYWGDDSVTCDGPKDMDEVKMKFDDLAAQLNDETSIYNFVKMAVKIRNTYPDLIHEKTVYNELSSDSVGVFERGNTLVVVNFRDSNQSVDVSKSDYQTLSATLNTNSDKVVLDNGLLSIPAYTIAILEK